MTLLKRLKDGTYEKVNVSREDDFPRAEAPYGCVAPQFRPRGNTRPFDYLGSELTDEQVKRVYGTPRGEKI